VDAAFLREAKGTHFDPAVVDAFLAVEAKTGCHIIIPGPIVVIFSAVALPACFVIIEAATIIVTCFYIKR
jgi:hypothetical protein